MPLQVDALVAHFLAFRDATNVPTLLWQSSLLVPPADIEYLDETEASISIPSVGV